MIIAPTTVAIELGDDAGRAARYGLLIHHDDAERECAYGAGEEGSGQSE